MILFRRYIVLVLGGVLLFFTSFEAKKIRNEKSSTYLTENVIVLVIDGPRFTETFGDTSYQYIPHLAKDLAPQGVLVTSFWNNGPTYTNAGHTAITTGNYQRISNVGFEHPKKPSMFQYYNKTYADLKASTYVIASKGKLNILGNTKQKAWKNQYLPTTYCGPNGHGLGYESDVKTWLAAKTILKEKHPKLTLINLLEVDVRGHEVNWLGYLQGIKNTDSLAFELWDFIQTDSIYRDKTTLIITNDHGRHSKGKRSGYVNHGCRCEGCKHIYLVALGPDFKKGSISKMKYEQLDISKTIAELLQFQMPTSKGKVMWDLFENPNLKQQSP